MVAIPPLKFASNMRYASGSVIRSNSASVCFKAITEAREGRVIKWSGSRPRFLTRSFESFRTRWPGGGHLWADSGRGNLLRSHSRNDATCVALADSPPPTTVRFSSCRGIRLLTVVEFRRISRTNLHMNMGRLPWQRWYHHLCLDVPLCEQSYPFRSFRVRIPVLRATWKKLKWVQKAKVSKLELKIYF